MVLWQPDLRISWRAVVFPAASRRGGGPGAVGSWPLSLCPRSGCCCCRWWSSTRAGSQRRIHAWSRGDKLLTDSRLRWQNAGMGDPRDAVGLSIAVCCWAVWCHVDTRRGTAFWLAADSMDAGEVARMSALAGAAKTGAGGRRQESARPFPAEDLLSHQLWMR